jgi:hypothetical protein
MRRLFLLGLTATMLLLALASAAAAEPPVTTVGQTPPVNSGYCSFPVYRSDVFALTTITKPDGTLITHIDRILTFTANGKTLTSNDHFTRFVDPTQPFLIDIAGHLIGVELPGRGPILLEVGHFILDVRNRAPPSSRPASTTPSTVTRRLSAPSSWPDADQNTIKEESHEGNRVPVTATRSRALSEESCRAATFVDHSGGCCLRECRPIESNF